MLRFAKVIDGPNPKPSACGQSAVQWQLPPAQRVSAPGGGAKLEEGKVTAPSGGNRGKVSAAWVMMVVSAQNN